MDYEAEDKAALEAALLSMRVCPRCRRDLLRVALLMDVFGCSGDGEHPPETWYLPTPAGREVL